MLLTPLLCADDNWTLAFSDEFNGAELDLTRWIPHDPRDTAHHTAEAVRVSGGQLHLGGAISTFGMFAQMYGRFEIRLRAAAGSELVLLPVPSGTLPQIEVLRALAPDKVFFANRWGSEQTERSYGDSFSIPDLSGRFHTIAIEWERNRIAWFVDGKKTFESTDGVPRQPMYLVIAAPTAPLDIDYVHIYRRPTVK